MRSPPRLDPGPAYRRIATDLRDRILAATLPPAARLSPEAELCREFGASRITIRSALRKLASEGLIRTVNGKGSFVADVVNRQRQIILVLDRPLRHVSHLNELVMGALLEAHEHGLGARVVTVAQLRGVLEELVASPGLHGGVICLRSRQPPLEDIDFAERHGIPCLIEGSQRPQGRHWMAVDNAGAMRRIVDHLHGLGRRRFGLFLARTGEAWSSFGERGEAVRRRLAELGIPAPDLTVIELPDETAIGTAPYLLSAAFFVGERPPDAIICVNDLIAVQVLRWAAEHGHRVPEDVAVTGFDDAEIARYAYPPLTTVRQAYPQVGAESVRLVLRMMDDAGNRRVRMLRRLELVVRESTRVPVPEPP